MYSSASFNSVSETSNAWAQVFCPSLWRNNSEIVFLKIFGPYHLTWGPCRLARAPGQVIRPPRVTSKYCTKAKTAKTYVWCDKTTKWKELCCDPNRSRTKPDMNCSKMYKSRGVSHGGPTSGNLLLAATLNLLPNLNSSSSTMNPVPDPESGFPEVNLTPNPHSDSLSAALSTIPENSTTCQYKDQHYIGSPSSIWNGYGPSGPPCPVPQVPHAALPYPHHNAHKSSYAHNPNEMQMQQSDHRAAATQNSVYLYTQPGDLFRKAGHDSMEDADKQHYIEVPNTTHRPLNAIRNTNVAPGGSVGDNGSVGSTFGLAAGSEDTHSELLLKHATSKKRKTPRMPQEGVSRYWTNEEHARFISALQACRGNANKFHSIALLVRTRSESQCRTHYQKWVQKMIRDAKKTVRTRNNEAIFWQSLAEGERQFLSEGKHPAEDETSKTTVPPAWGVSLLAEVLCEIEPKMNEWAGATGRNRLVLGISQ